MKAEHLYERTQDYENSIKTVVDKRVLWNEKTKELLLATLTRIVDMYDLGWKVQELSWIRNNEAVNITFDSFPPALIDCTNLIPAYQFIPGASLIFSQTYNGDIIIFMLYPELDGPPQNNMLEFGVHNPESITEKLIVEMVDEFLKEIIKWEVPSLQKKLGFQS